MKRDRAAAGKRARELGAYLEGKTLKEIRLRYGFAERATSRGFRGSKDWLGIADFVCIEVGEPPLMVNSTTRGSLSAHLRKISRPPCEDKARQWLRAGGRIEVYAWEKVGNRYVPQVVVVDESTIARCEKRRRRSQ